MFALAFVCPAVVRAASPPNPNIQYADGIPPGFWHRAGAGFASPEVGLSGLQKIEFGREFNEFDH